MKKKEKAEEKSKLVKAAKELATSADEQAQNSGSDQPPHKWCSTYPGSIVSLMNPPLTKSGAYDMKIVSWNINGLRAWMKVSMIQYKYLLCRKVVWII